MSVCVPKPVVLVILDGWGINPSSKANAVDEAAPPFYKSLLERYAHTQIEASGLAVGLPEGQMGNSEVGHLNIGAGRIVYQELTRIGRAISNGDFQKQEVLVSAMDAANENKGTFHLLGLLSDGGVHSHIDHFAAILEMANQQKVERLRIHPFLDGRDVPPKSALIYIERLEKMLLGFAPEGADWKIASVSGRFYAMDRDQRWERTETAYRAIVHGKGIKAAAAMDAVQKSYDAGITDEFVAPIVLCEGEKPVGRIEDGDSVFFLNFRADRARQMCRVFTEKTFTEFDRVSYASLSSFASLTAYSADFDFPVVFKSVKLEGILGAVLSQQGLKQLRIAETEKYAHVTYFFNGGSETAFEGEERILIPSPKDVQTYDQKPQMSAAEVTEALLAQIARDYFDFICVNYANPDMVGHSGILPAAVKAVAVIDQVLEALVSTVLAKDGVVLITADHGNLEQMTDYETGQPHTAHTTFPVPFILVSKEKHTLKSGIHADIAPTILDLMQIPKPSQMDHDSLIVN
ncbi:MAG: 2,3-bisphosphoglycerate-independent phosphoglycerate mutase [Nitrospirae bacterium]|nr:2,3-bisphosphoglycerate-independent phosphoglycerate mutase [Candidatus Manganitrophaceae bacterium]